MKVWVVQYWEDIQGVFSTEEKAKIYSSIYGGSIEEYEVDDNEIGSEMVCEYDIFMVFIDICFNVTRVCLSGGTVDYKNTAHLHEFPKRISLNTDTDTFLCNLYIPKGDICEPLEVAKSLVLEEKKRIMGENE